MKPLGLDEATIKVEAWLHFQIQHALVELLETKQLYQNVTVDLNPVHERISEITDSRRVMSVIDGPARTREELNRQTQAPYRTGLAMLTVSSWSFDTEYYPLRTQGHNQGAGPIYFRTPTIKVTCNFCDAVLPPHNSGYAHLKDSISSVHVGTGSHGVKQVFSFPFLCQSCKKYPGSTW